MSKRECSVIVGVENLVQDPVSYKDRKVAVLGERFELVSKALFLEKGKSMPVFFYNLYQGNEKILLYTKDDNLEKKKNYLIEGEWKMSIDRLYYYLHNV